MTRNKRGFTIVELIIVIAVIAILASILIPTFVGLNGAAKNSKALVEAKSGWDDYLAKTDGHIPSKDAFILYRHDGLEKVFRVKGAAFDGAATEEEIQALQAMDKSGKLTPDVCGYEYNPDTGEMLNYYHIDPLDNTTEEQSLIGG